MVAKRTALHARVDHEERAKYLLEVGVDTSCTDIYEVRVCVYSDHLDEPFSTCLQNEDLSHLKWF
ncbi:uncharacterized protein LOC143222917 isoform X3 [Tachypleus tridentatus]|uniref:uncharacterized protein LOC143222917 isoform X3 n=1 Tax=Tachypleus tridentatus TaxID=6853 RepID=UPI003FD24496